MESIHQVHSNSLNNMLCSNCAKYLSSFPVHSNPNGTSTCGRCPTPPDSVQNFLYENAVEYYKFPCCYDSSGCIERLFPREVPRHEKLCPFKKYSCPYIGDCNWGGFPRDLLSHFESKHPTFVLAEGMFEVDFVNNHKEKYLLPYGEELYTVDISNDSKNKNFCCNVTYVGSNPQCETYQYKLALEDSGKQYRHEVTKGLGEGIELSGEEVMSLLNQPLSIVAKVEVIYEVEKAEEAREEERDEDSQGIDKELLKELECLICYEHMIPPIYQCLTGHSICSVCQKDLTECPYCKKGFQNTINFALAQIINHINYPCKYDKCNFVCKAKDIRQHEAICIYGPYPCPLRDYLGCDANLIFTEVYDHIRNDHYENLLELEVVKIPISHENNIEDCFIIRSCNKLFKLHLLFNDDNDDQLCFAVQLIGQAEECKNYRFEIDVMDGTGSNCRIYFKRMCSPLANKEVTFNDHKDYIFVDYDHIRDMITTELMFRVRVLKV